MQRYTKRREVEQREVEVLDDEEPITNRELMMTNVI